MVIFIRFKKIWSTLLIVAFLAVCGLGIYLWNIFGKTPTTFIDESENRMLAEEVQLIFNIRNKALLEEDIDILGSLYNKDVRNGLWAYEHELKKMKYLHKWSDKQAVEFRRVDSQVILRNAKSKGEGFSVNLLVSTEYEYIYKDGSQTTNTFRIGTYHSLDLVQKDEKWNITREWYTDPFADSLHLDEIKSKEVREVILSGQPRDLTDLNERRIPAVEYADKYCGAASLPEYDFKYNPKYKNYNSLGGDCANFASQMLSEGGKFRKNGTWNYERGSGSKAWVNANAFNSYMIYNGRASVIAHNSYEKVLKDSYKLLPGDYVAYEKGGKVVHISVVTGLDSKGYALVNSHNSDRYRVPWDLGWSNKGMKFWLVRVHY